ncbi:MAG TPA: hypothetical protein PKE40_02505 [Arachnia sp.]|nr:hypothetical protein [Arachnia sp.]HMT85201.1 hypothetical protein [Arachnia sp.]
MKRLLNKLGGNLVAQAIAALSNFALSVLIARSLDKAAFGSFAMAYVVYGIAFAAMKAVVGQPLQIRFSAAEPEELHRRTGHAMGATLGLSIVVAAVVAVVGWALGGTTGQALVVLAVWLPALLLQDSCRMAFFAYQLPWRAAIVDTVWAVVQFGLLALLIAAGTPSLGWLMSAWGIGAVASAVAGLLLLRVVPRIAETFTWLREQATLSRYLLAEYILGLGAVQVGTLLIGFILAPAAVGSLRAAQVLLGPLQIVSTASFQFTVPEIARHTGWPARRLLGFAGAVAAGLLFVHVVYVVALLVMPDAWGHFLFADSWRGGALVLLPMGIAACLSCLANPPAGVLYGLGKARVTFRINMLKAPIILVLLLSGTFLFGVVGSAWAFVSIEAIILPFWILALVQASRRPRRMLADEAGEADKG